MQKQELTAFASLFSAFQLNFSYRVLSVIGNQLLNPKSGMKFSVKSSPKGSWKCGRETPYWFGLSWLSTCKY